MNRRFLVSALILFLVGGAAVWLVWRFVEAPASRVAITEKDVAQWSEKVRGPAPKLNAVPEPIRMTQTVRLAIGSLGYPDDAQNQELGDLITAQLSSSKGLELVERQELNAVLKEEELNLSGLVRARDAVRAGRLLRADWFLLGTAAQIHGTNCLVVRLVDTRTGITRDGAVFVQKAMPALAAEVAGFVRQQRQAAAEAKPRVYLAIGTFEDLSANNRQAGFPSQLRGYLSAAYQHSRFTLLEREYADILLQEMEMDLAGLTAEGAARAPAPMQSAFWLVDGYYQSYETTNLEVEVTLEVHRIFSTSKQVTVRGLPGEPVCRQIKQAIDRVLDQNQSIVMPTWTSEARTEMSAGKRLAAPSGHDSELIFDFYQQLDEQEAALRHHNLEEAIRAFDTVLLLEPTNRQAKFYLAACLGNQFVGQVDKARSLYHEILEEPVLDKWTLQAKQALLASFEWSGPQEKARWFEGALHGNTNSTLAKFYQDHAELAERDVTIARGDGDATKLAQQRLLEAIRSCKNVMEGKSGTCLGGYGLYEFQAAFPDKATAARKMAQFLPRMESEFPQLAPHLAAEVLSFQVDSNSPVVEELRKQLEWCQAHPSEVFKPQMFWSDLTSSAFDWLFRHQHYQLAVKVMESWRAAAKQKIVDRFGSEDQIALGFAYMGAKRWQAALETFGSFSNLPVLMSSDGPWGPGWKPVLTRNEADYCRTQLGLPVVRDPREFEMGGACLCLCTPSTFAVGDDGLWVGIGDKLIHLDFNLKTNLEVTLPKDASTPVTCLCVGASSLWIGTAGEGLIEFDKGNHRCRRFTVKDGLMMNEICCAQLSGDALWIGYGHQNGAGWKVVSIPTGGGMGFLNLRTRDFTSFTPSLAEKTGDGSGEAPPQSDVTALAVDASGDVWYVQDGYRVHRFRSKDNVWEGVTQVPGGCCLTTGAGKLFVGQFRGLSGGTRSGPIGLYSLSFGGGQWGDFEAVDGLPSYLVSALALDNNDLWIGGMGYIALIDLGQARVRKIAYIGARSVNKIQIGGGYVWAQYDWHLHRALLSDIE